jgi:hypothetical protein
MALDKSLVKFRPAFAAALLFTAAVAASGQVFVVGERSATAHISTDFKPTELSLPTAKMTERGRRELIRNLVAEQGFAHRSLPMGASLTLQANGPLSPGAAEYKKMIYEKGESAAPGDRVAVTSLEIKGDHIIVDLNGGPYLKHRFLRHVSFNDSAPASDLGERATGSRVTLVFAGPVPEVSAPEVKALLEPIIDFGVKSTEQAYADTLPPILKEAIAAHDVLVGMNHRMVLAAMGAPENKLRDQPSGDPNGGRYEEWIYGHVPQTVRFVRFVGDRVTLVEIAAMGKPIEIHDKDELGDFNPPIATREVAMGDQRPGETGKTPPPTLRKPGEPEPTGGSNKVQFPTTNQPASTKASSIPDSSPIPDSSTEPPSSPHLR